MVGADSLQDTKHTYGINIGRKLGGIERYLHMALRSQIIDFGGLHLANQLDQRHGIAHIGIMKVEMGRALEVGYTLAVINRGTTDNAVHLITLL